MPNNRESALNMPGKNTWKALVGIGFYISLLMLSSKIALLFDWILGQVPGQEHNPFSDIAIQAVLLVVFIWMYAPRLRYDLQRITFKNIIKEVLLGFLARAILMSLVQLIVTDTKAQNQLSIETMFQAVPVWMMFFVLCISAPIVEELVFRHMFIGELAQHRVWKFLWIVVSMCLFTLLHSGLRFQEALLYLPLTLVFTGSYLRNKENVIVSIAAHMVNNLLAFIVIMFVLNGIITV